MVERHREREFTESVSFGRGKLWEMPREVLGFSCCGGYQAVRGGWDVSPASSAAVRRLSNLQGYRFGFNFCCLWFVNRRWWDADLLGFCEVCRREWVLIVLCNFAGYSRLKGSKFQLIVVTCEFWLWFIGGGKKSVLELLWKKMTEMKWLMQRLARLYAERII